MQGFEDGGSGRIKARGMIRRRMPSGHGPDGWFSEKMMRQQGDAIMIRSIGS
jgi:hypothetical protein